MEKTAKHMRVIRILSALLDAIILLYFASYMYWTFVVIDMDKHWLSTLFLKVTPMTIGTYCMGAAMILHLIAFRNSIGRWVI